MQFGVAKFCTDYTIGPAELAIAIEERDFDLFMVPEHTHTPASRESAYPDGGELPREYNHVLDPFVALAAAAAVTKRLRLGTGICLVVERDPIVLAKEVATLDLLSDGRFTFGVGGGWNREEMADHGTAFETRWILLRERIEAMKALWTTEEATYHGRFVNFERAWQWPKPVQQPHPPILVAGDGERTLNRVARYGDGWLPPYFCGPQRLRQRLAELKELAAGLRRGPLPATVFGCPPDAQRIDDYLEAGAAGVVFWMPSCSRDEAMKHLDQYAQIRARYVP